MFSSYVLNIILHFLGYMYFWCASFLADHSILLNVFYFIVCDNTATFQGKSLGEEKKLYSSSQAHMKYSINLMSANISHCIQYFKHMPDCQVCVKRRGGYK